MLKNELQPLRAPDRLQPDFPPSITGYSLIATIIPTFRIMYNMADSDHLTNPVSRGTLYSLRVAWVSLSLGDRGRADEEVAPHHSLIAVACRGGATPKPLAFF